MQVDPSLVKEIAYVATAIAALPLTLAGIRAAMFLGRSMQRLDSMETTFAGAVDRLERAFTRFVDEQKVFRHDTRGYLQSLHLSLTLAELELRQLAPADRKIDLKVGEVPE